MSKEKKQYLVLGILVLVVGAVGAFQFMGPKSKPEVAVEEEQSAPTGDQASEVSAEVAQAETLSPTELAIQELMKGPMTDPRDPFAPQAVMADAPKEHVEAYQPPVERTVSQRPPTEITGEERIVPPVDLEGLGLGDKIDASDNPFGLLGVVIGRRTVAVFDAGEGRFALAEVGEKVGKMDNTYVESISEKKVVIKHRGKLRELELRGGNQ